MARPKLVSPDQPFPVRLVLGFFEFCASLKLAVILILAVAGVLTLGTIVEAAWGTPAAQFGTYQTWWFNLCLALLAVNIFSAAAIRYPWKRHQTGFVITHIGLLVLLLGAAIGRIHGIDAQIFVFELGADHRAYADDLKFQLTVKKPGEAETVVVLDNFHPGVFSWPDYQTMFRFRQPDDGSGPEWLAWKLFRASCGWMFAIADRTSQGETLYNRDGVKLEVLDYYADSRQVAAPMVELMLTMPSSPRLNAEGKPEAGPPRWAPFTLSVTAAPQQADQYPFGLGARELAGGGHLAFWLAGSPEQVQAFLDGGPEGPLGEKGQVVLFVGGKKHRFLVDDKLDQGRFALEGSDYEAEVVAYWPQRDVDREKSREGRIVWTGNPSATSADDPGVKIALYRDGQAQSELVLFARAPDDNIYDHKNKVFGDYWFDQTKAPADGEQAPPMMSGGGSRIDILQGPDEKLYYRYWRRNERRLEFARELPTTGSPETAVPGFIMPLGEQKLYVKQFLPSPQPVREMFVPLPFSRDKNIGTRQPAAKVRLTVDDKSEEFWILAYIGPPEEPPHLESQQRTVAGLERSASLIMPVDSVDIGFRTRLAQFERKLDPGTSQPSHYSSTIDIIDRDRDRTIAWASFARPRATDLQAPIPHEPGAVASASAVAFDPRERFLYWIDPRQRSIQRVQVAGNKLDPVVKGLVEDVLRDPQDLELDLTAKKMYWTDRAASRSGDRGYLYRADLDGKGQEVVAQVVGFPTDLALDPQERVIYWLDPLRGSIGRVTYEGGVEEDVITGLSAPGGMTFDPATQQLFWTEPEDGVIRRAQADGSGERVIVVRQGFEKPAHIAVDSAAGKIYWSDVGEGPIRHVENGPSVPERVHKIRRANLDGSEVQDVVSRGVFDPGDLAIDADGQRLFWSQDAAFRRDVWITMNAPIEFSDPHTHRRYRIFQEAFNGPWKPGDREFEANVPASSDKAELYQSVLTVNSDPGRPVRNAGCLLVVIGIATMFYMRAYFFTGKRVAREPSPHLEEERPAAASPRKGRKKKAEPVV